MPKPVPSPSCAAQHRVGGHPNALEAPPAPSAARSSPSSPLDAPKLSPGLSFSTMNADIPRGPSAAGARHHHVDVGGSGSGDELFDAVQHVIATLLDGAGAQRAGIRAGARLGQAVAGNDIHRGQPRHPGLALFGGAEGVDHPGAHVVDGQERGDRRAGHRQLLEDPHPVETAQCAAAHVVAAVDRRHAESGRLTQYVDRKVMRRIPFQGMRGQPFGRERGRRFGDDPLVVVQTEELHQASNSSSG